MAGAEAFYLGLAFHGLVVLAPVCFCTLRCRSTQDCSQFSAYRAGAKRYRESPSGTGGKDDAPPLLRRCACLSSRCHDPRTCVLLISWSWSTKQPVSSKQQLQACCVGSLLSLRSEPGSQGRCFALAASCLVLFSPAGNLIARNCGPLKPEIAVQAMGGGRVLLM